MVSKKLNIAPDGGHLLGGIASYAADPVTGKIHYAVTAALSFFGTHNVNTSGDYQVDPKLLKSASAKVGEVIKLGQVTLTVEKIEEKLAYAGLKVEGYGEGQVVISLAGDVIEIMSIVANVRYAIASAHLVAS